MPRRSLRTRSRKRVKVRTPGSRVVVHYRDEKPGPARCAVCGGKLFGIPREKPYKLHYTERTVSRMYGGSVCHRCLREGLKMLAAREWGIKTPPLIGRTA
ncbi:MAG: 60S ribosomal protein L34 [Aigarchaeota archaeon]|nr:60S ribosomal protein L34 [Candidatus Pelearchaeum maunauluense]